MPYNAPATNAISFSIYMEAQSAIEHLAATAMGLDSYLNSALVTSANFVKEEMKGRAPEGVAGANGQGLENTIGIDYDVNLGLGTHNAEIKPTVPYADAVETGSKPHMPPTDPDGALAQWCEMKGLSLWAVASSIKRKGTEPHPYIEPTYNVMKERVYEVFSAGVKQYMESVKL